MSIVQNQNIPTPERMWEFIDKVLGPIGMTPDKASLDKGEIFGLYLELIKLDNSFLDSIHAHVLKNQLAYLLLENLTN
jgi:hypothetical protein